MSTTTAISHPCWTATAGLHDVPEPASVPREEGPDDHSGQLLHAVRITAGGHQYVLPAMRQPGHRSGGSGREGAAAGRRDTAVGRRAAGRNHWIPPYAGSPPAPSPRPGRTLPGGTRPPVAPPPSVPYRAAPFATPNGVPTDGALANWENRAGGLLLDGALLFAAALPFLLIGLVVPFLFFLGLLVGIAGGIYFGAQIGETGQSPGMRVVGVKCVHQQTGQIIGSGAGILRWLRVQPQLAHLLRRVAVPAVGHPTPDAGGQDHDDGGGQRAEAELQPVASDVTLSAR